MGSVDTDYFDLAKSLLTEPYPMEFEREKSMFLSWAKKQGYCSSREDINKTKEPEWDK